MNEPWLKLRPENASRMAERIDLLFLVEALLIVAVVGGVLVLMVLFARRFHHARRVDRSDIPRGRRARRWEIAWSLIPLAIFIGMFVQGTRLYQDMVRPPDDALQIHAIGKQWMWKFQHPQGQREINTLHVPLGRPVRVTLVSQDVIHSFFVPAFRVKQDAVPGRYTHTWFEASKTGTYHLLCAEFCGTDHSRMRGRIIVQRPDEYARWLARQPADSDLVRAGERLFRKAGCSGCHAPQSDVHAPPLDGLFGSTVVLQDGRRVLADETYLRDAILLPQKHLVAGYDGIMPSFKQQFSEAELLQLISYLKQREVRRP